MTIFGFNTDVKSGDTVYHVQTEARQGDLALQTLVFVKGQCIGKRSSRADAGGSQSVHELLKAQHKLVIDAVNEGRLDSVLAANGDHSSSSNGASAEPTVVIEFQITDSGQVVPGAEVISRAGTSSDGAIVARATSDASGTVKMTIPFGNGVKRDGAITVEASYAGKVIKRKFKIREASKTH